MYLVWPFVSRFHFSAILALTRTIPVGKMSCVQCLLFWPSLKSILEFCFKNSASFFLPICFIYLSFCYGLCFLLGGMALLSFSQARPLGHPHVPASCQCFSCSKSGDGMELAESWSSCFVAFLGLPLLSSTQAGERGGEEWKHLAAMSKTVLGCSWSPHPPWVWFYSHGPGGVKELEWG